jgi:hypothetical protein
VTLSGGFALLAILVVGIMVPGGPGMTGTFELALSAGFSLLLLSEESRANITVYIIMLHVTQLLVQVVCGLPFMVGRAQGLKAALRETPVD